jgi:arylformamidase
MRRIITDHLSRAASRSHYDEGVEFQIGRIEMVSNTGTYVDSPWHRWADGVDLAGLPIERLADVDGVLIDARTRAVGADELAGRELAGRAVLVRTGWDRYWRTERYGDPTAPHLTPEAAEVLVEAGAAIVGIDSVNIDDMSHGSRPVHSALLAAGIPIVEHLTAFDALVLVERFRFSAVPVPVIGMGTFPVRAYAVID